MWCGQHNTKIVCNCHQDEEEQGRNNDLYDMDDDWIDDTELQEYYGGDRRKTKITGFFINKVSLSRSQGTCPGIVQSGCHNIGGGAESMSLKVLGGLVSLRFRDLLLCCVTAQGHASCETVVSSRSFSTPGVSPSIHE